MPSNWDAILERERARESDPDADPGESLRRAVRDELAKTRRARERSREATEWIQHGLRIFAALACLGILAGLAWQLTRPPQIFVGPRSIPREHQREAHPPVRRPRP